MNFSNSVKDIFILHKKQFLLNFIILLFALNIFLKSACTGDVDLNGGNIINVDEIIYVIPPTPSIPTVEYDGVLYASPLVSDGVFANVAGVVANCASTDTNIALQYLIPQSALTTYCPAGSQRETVANAPSPGTLFTAIKTYTSGNGSSCSQGAVLFHFPSDTTDIYYTTSTTATSWSNTGISSYYTSPLCRIDGQ